MAGITITPVEGTRLFSLYPRQSAPQGAFIALDVEDGRMWAGYNPEIANGVPMDVWHNLTLRFSLPGPLRGVVATELMHRILPDAQILIGHSQIVWDGSNHVARFDSTAVDAIGRIESIISGYGEEDNYIQWEDAVEWLEPERDDIIARLVEAGRPGGVSSEDTPYDLMVDECDRISEEQIEDGSEDRPILINLDGFLGDCRESAANILDEEE
jgi:hypothetical protein